MLPVTDHATLMNILNHVDIYFFKHLGYNIMDYTNYTFMLAVQRQRNTDITAI